MLGKTAVREAVAKRAGLNKSQAARAVEAVLGTVSDALRRGEEVRLTGFGSFKVTQTKARMGRNPRTGAQIRIVASRRPAFSAGSRLRSAVKGSR